MNFKGIIKQEWEKEFPNDLGEPIEIEDSIFFIYQELVERICVKVWNEATIQSTQNVKMIYGEVDVEGIRHSEPVDIDYSSILKLLIDEQGTNTTEV